MKIPNFIFFFLFPILLLGQFNQNTNRSLFSDVKASKVGDAVLILIVEDTKANNTASTDSKRNTDINASLGYQAGTSNEAFGGNIGTGNRFAGSGQTNRSETIRSKVSARVVEVDQVGNLKIQAKRTTKVNGETQTITLEGLVRPVDINSENAIFSYNIMDLKLTIEGNGSLTEVQEPGLLTKFLRILF